MEQTKKKRKINPIDILVVIVIIAILALGGYKLLNREDGVATKTTPITYTVLCTGVEPQVYDAVLEHVPSQLMASGAMVDGSVVAVTAEPHTPGLLSTAGGQPVMMEESDLLDLTFTIEANVKNTVTNEVGTQEVRIGKNHTVKTVYFEFNNGVILTCEWGENAE